MASTDEETNRLDWANPLNKKRNGCVPERISRFLAKNKSVCYLSMLMNVTLTVGLILACTIRFGTRNLDIEEQKYKSGSSPAVPYTDAVTETKNQYVAPCEEDWIWYRGKCYFFSKDSDTWENSQNFCISHNASLALIDTQDELDVLLQFKGSQNHWIGLRRTDDNKAWTWTNGTLYSESLFRILRSSQKNIEHVYLNYEGVKSQEGTIPFKWICRKS